MFSYIDGLLFWNALRQFNPIIISNSDKAFDEQLKNWCDNHLDSDLDIRNKFDVSRDILNNSVYIGRKCDAVKKLYSDSNGHYICYESARNTINSLIHIGVLSSDFVWDEEYQSTIAFLDD